MRSMSVPRLTVVPAILFALVVVVLATHGAAQTPPKSDGAPAPPPFLLLSVQSIRPDMMAAYIDLQKSEVMPALQKGGVTGREVWQTAVFGSAFEFASVQPVTDIARFDQPSPLRQGLGEAGLKAYQEKAGKMMLGIRTYLLRTRPDLGIASQGPAAKTAILTTVDTVPGHQGEFEAFLKNDFVPALKKAQVNRYFVSQVVYGGSATEYITVLYVENFAEIAKGHPVARVLGEDGYNKLLSKVGPAIRTIDRRMIRLNDELSFQVKSTSEAR